MTFGFAVCTCFVVVVSVLTTQSEGTERCSHAQTKLLHRFGVRCLEIVGDVVCVQFGSGEVVRSAKTIFRIFAICRYSIFSTELLNSSTDHERTTSIGYAHAITFSTITTGSNTSTCDFVLVIANKRFNAYTTELTSVVNTVRTNSVEATTHCIVTSYQIRSLEIIATTNGIHGGVVTTQQHLTEATFQTHYGATVKTTILEITISRVKTSFNVEYGRQTVTQVFLTFQAPAGARQVARHQTSCTCFGSNATLFSFSLNNTVASVNNAVQSYGRLCGSSAHSSQSGNSNQRFFHCKFLQG